MVIDQHMMSALGPLLGSGAALDLLVGESKAEVTSILERTRPSMKYLRALGDELLLAQRSPGSVPYPELVDPEVYWTKAAWPQAAAAVAAAREYLIELRPRVEMIMIGAEADMKGWVSQLIFEGTAAADPVADPRSGVINAIVERCEQFDGMIRALESVAPEPEAMAQLRREFELARHRSALAEVKKLKSVYLRQAGGDPEHQRVAKEEWQATVDNRVAHRSVELQGELPWRHQELAIEAHERAAQVVRSDIETMVNGLADGVLAIGERLVLHYDDARTGRVL